MSKLILVLNYGIQKLFTYTISVLTYYSSNSRWEGWSWSSPWPANRRRDKCVAQMAPMLMTGDDTPAQSMRGTAASIARIPSLLKRTSAPPVQEKILVRYWWKDFISFLLYALKVQSFLYTQNYLQRYLFSIFGIGKMNYEL